MHTSPLNVGKMNYYAPLQAGSGSATEPAECTMDGPCSLQFLVVSRLFQDVFPALLRLPAEVQLKISVRNTMRVLMEARRRTQPPLPQSVPEMWQLLQRPEHDHERYSSMEENAELLVHDLVGPPGRRSLVICFRSVMLWLQGLVNTTFDDATFDITPIMEVST